MCAASSVGETYILIRADEEAVVHESLHQAGFSHALLPQHDHLGIHTLARHGGWRTERQVESEGQGRGAGCGVNVTTLFTMQLKEMAEVWSFRFGNVILWK